MKPKPPKDLWAAMDAIAGGHIQDDEGFTILEYAARYRIGETQAGRNLKRLVQEGKLIEGRKKGNRGMFVKVFRPA